MSQSLFCLKLNKYYTISEMLFTSAPTILCNGKLANSIQSDLTLLSIKICLKALSCLPVDVCESQTLYRESGKLTSLLAESEEIKRCQRPMNGAAKHSQRN